MISILFGLIGMVGVNGSSVGAVKANCETYAPNIEGIRVTVCDGEVVKREDASGVVLYAPWAY